MWTSHQPGSIKKFRRTPWRFQATFHTPLDNLDPFVAAILGSHGQVESGTVTIEAVVMGANKLMAVSPVDQFRHDTAVCGETAKEVHRLLVAALGDWVDFLFIPEPKPFVVYADHDEYTTFFANTKSNLNKVISALEREGFKFVEGYTRARQ
jgi:hypothetical protein